MTNRIGPNHRQTWLIVLGLVAAFAWATGCDREEEARATGVSGSDELVEVRDEAPCPEDFAAELTTGDYQGFVVGGEERSFHLVVPMGEPPAEGYPLLFAFHGTTETGRGFVERANLSDFADHGFVVVAPNAEGHGTIWPVWDALRIPTNPSIHSPHAPNQDLLLFDRLTSCLAERLELDEGRYFVAGHSAGGIMTNRVLRERSHVVAGGITGSGLFELTGTSLGQTPESPLTVIVTWGGDNDVYSGATSDGTRIARFHFAEQAALASCFYVGLENVRHVQCKGADRGHAWLTALNPWMIDALLSDQGTALSPPTLAGVATCSTTAAELPAPPLQAPSCANPDHPLCAQACGQFADCLLANGTLGPTLQGLVSRLGVTNDTCQPCLQGCAQLASDPAEEALLRCLTVADPQLTCGPGIKGALPFIDRLNTCCSDHPTSSQCDRLCAGISSGDAARYFLPVCGGE